MRNKIFFYFVYNTERGRIGYTRKGATVPAAERIHAHTVFGRSIAQWSMMSVAYSKPASQTFLLLLPS